MKKDGYVDIELVVDFENIRCRYRYRYKYSHIDRIFIIVRVVYISLAEHHVQTFLVVVHERYAYLYNKS